MENVVKYWNLEEGYSVDYDDNSFFAYDVNGDEFYVAHAYVENRSKSYAFFKRLKDKARECGCKYISGNLEINDANKESYTKKVMVHIGNGYRIVNVTDKRITVVYDL